MDNRNPGDANVESGRESRAISEKGFGGRQLSTAQDPVASGESAISFNDVSYHYENGLEVVDNFRLEVPRGRSIGIVGPSGCGKSTLLSFIAGLRTVTGGTLTVRHYDRSTHPLSMVFQEDTLLPWLTTVENIRLYFKLHKQHGAEIEQRITDLVKLASLEGFERSYPKQLSGGMRRRVAFLTAVAPRPEILLLDEPFSSLDEPTRIGIHQDVFRIVRAFGMTVLLVTHDLAEAISLCDEVIILTRRPATLASRHSVPFGQDRQMLGLRHEPKFLEMYGMLWEELSVQISAARG